MRYRKVISEEVSDEKIAAAVAINITTDISHIRQDKDIKAGIHLITTIKHPFSITAAPTIPVTVNKTIEYSTLINTGAELNIITKNVADRAGLTIRTRVKIKISLYSEHINRFLRMVKNILISVDLIVCRANIFIIWLAP